MDLILQAISWVQSNGAGILGVLLAISEALSLIPGVKANGIFQLVWGWLKAKKPAA